MDKLLKRAEVAEILRVSLGCVDKLRREGRIDYIRIGSTAPRFPESAVREFVMKNTHKAGEAE